MLIHFRYVYERAHEHAGFRYVYERVQYMTILMSILQWRNYYGLRPGEPGGPQPQWIAVFNLPYSLLFRSRCGRIDYLSIIRRFIYLYTVKGHAIKYSFFICSN